MSFLGFMRAHGMNKKKEVLYRQIIQNDGDEEKKSVKYLRAQTFFQFTLQMEFIQR